MTDAAPAFLQLVGHPLRWQLLTDLAGSDRTVQELTARAGEPQNLVSYHLGKLRAAGLVRVRRSTFDRRGTYYAADLATLDDRMRSTAGALHPGLVPAGGPAPSGHVLFLCTGNSARSQLAEAITRVRSSGAVAASSAGSAPKPLHPNAARLLRERYGADLARHRPKHLDEVAAGRFDRVVTLCDRVREVCPDFPGHPTATHWSTPDPAAGHADDDASYPDFCAVADELELRIGFLLRTLAPKEAP